MIMACAIMGHSQDSTALLNAEERIQKLLSSSISQNNDSARIALAQQAADEMAYLLEDEMAYNYGFPNLKNISSLQSPDNNVKVITLGTALRSGKYVYQGFVATRKGGDITITRLIDDRKKTPNPERASMQNTNWYGAIYYEITQYGSKSSPVYALCGWDGHNQYTNRKVLEQMQIDENGIPRFGGQFASESGGGYTRLIFEFAESAVMSLQYNKKLKMIVGDHLNTLPQYIGNPNFRKNPKIMGPDLSFDGYRYNSGSWEYIEDVDVTIRN